MAPNRGRDRPFSFLHVAHATPRERFRDTPTCFLSRFSRTFAVSYRWGCGCDQPAPASQRRPRRQAGIGFGDHVQQFADRQCDSHGQDRVDRHVHPHGACGRDDHARRIRPAAVEGVD